MIHEQETWRTVPGWEGVYEASDKGRIRSLSRLDSIGRKISGRVLSFTTQDSGHLRTTFTRNGACETVLVHRVVLSAFVGPCPIGMEACHNNGKSWDNRITNLRWDTHSSNRLDAVKHGVDARASRTHCKRGHAYDETNTHWEGTTRRCRPCASLGKRTRYYLRKGGAK